MSSISYTNQAQTPFLLEDKKDSKENVLQKVKNAFEKLKTDPKSVFLFLKKKKKREKLQKLTYNQDSLLLKLINISEQKISNENIPLTTADWVEKRKINRSTLYSFDGPFQLIHANVGNLDF